MSNKFPVSLHIQRIKESTSPLVFSSYFKIINHVHEIWFCKHTFKRTRWFLRICRIFDKLLRSKIWELLRQYGRKNLVTTIFFEQKIKEKLNTWFDYYIWKGSLLNFVVSNLFVVWVKPHIFVLCPFCNYYPILFQLGTWHYCCNCFKLMLWMWCQCFRSNFFNFTVWKSLNNLILPKIDHFWQFCLLYLDLLFII